MEVVDVATIPRSDSSIVISGLSKWTSLPNEILHLIFQFCRLMSRSVAYANRLGWTQVCQKWRHIAFNTPDLWQDIDVYEIRYTIGFLNSTKAIPRSIHCGDVQQDDFSKDEPLFDILCEYLKNIDRDYIHTWHVRNNARNIDKLNKTMRYWMGSLTDVKLLCPQDALINSDVLLVCVEWHSITHLELENISWQFQECENLQVLKVYGSKPTPTSLMDMTELLWVLKCSPNLTLLELDSIHIKDDLDGPNGYYSLKKPRIGLKKLQKMRLIGLPASITDAIISRIFIGTGTSVHVDMQFGADPHPFSFALKLQHLFRKPPFHVVDDYPQLSAIIKLSQIMVWVFRYPSTDARLMIEFKRPSFDLLGTPNIADISRVKAIAWELPACVSRDVDLDLIGRFLQTYIGLTTLKIIVDDVNDERTRHVFDILSNRNTPMETPHCPFLKTLEICLGTAGVDCSSILTVLKTGAIRGRNVRVNWTRIVQERL